MSDDIQPQKPDILSPPAAFSFDAKDWLRWSKHFKRKHIASGLSKEGDEVQVDSLIYIMGPEAEDVLASFNLTNAQAKKVQDCFDRFEAHYIGQKNVVYERAKFNSRIQGPCMPFPKHASMAR